MERRPSAMQRDARTSFDASLDIAWLVQSLDSSLGEAREYMLVYMPALERIARHVGCEWMADMQEQGDTLETWVATCSAYTSEPCVGVWYNSMGGVGTCECCANHWYVSSAHTPPSSAWRETCAFPLHAFFYYALMWVVALDVTHHSGSPS